MDYGACGGGSGKSIAVRREVGVISTLLSKMAQIAMMAQNAMMEKMV